MLKCQETEILKSMKLRFIPRELPFLGPRSTVSPSAVLFPVSAMSMSAFFVFEKRSLRFAETQGAFL